MMPDMTPSDWDEIRRQMAEDGRRAKNKKAAHDVLVWVIGIVVAVVILMVLLRAEGSPASTTGDPNPCEGLYIPTC